MNDHHLEQLVHFTARENNTLDLIITAPGQLVDIYSHDRLKDHDIVSGTLKVVISPLRKVIEKRSTGTGAIKRQILLLKPKWEINKYYK